MTELVERNEEMNLNVHYRSCPGVILTSSGGRFYLVTVSDSIMMNESALYFWSCLEGGASVQDLVNASLTRYDITDSTIVQRDIEEFLQMCIRKDLIEEYGE